MRTSGDLGEVTDCDVLVIGGGIAGIFCAIRASEEAKRVIVVDKGFVGKTSHTAFSAGATVVHFPDQDFDTSMEDLVKVQEGLIDQELAEYILKNSSQRVKDLERWGVDFVKRGGDLLTLPSRGTRSLKMIAPFDQGGGVLRLVMREALSRGVRIMNRIFISDLLKHDGEVVGAAGTDTQNGAFKIFRAKATVIATNSIGFRGHYMGADMVGDGPALAYFSGADIKNAEFNRMNTGSPYYHYEGTGPAAAFGARFRNAQGEAFMERYEPELKDRVDVGPLSRAMALERKAGRAPLFFDFGPALERMAEVTRLQKYNWRLVHHIKLEKKGVEIRKPEWMPLYFYSLGAIKTDFGGASSLSGLFAAGKARSFCISYMTGWSWCSCMATGLLAGKSAGEYARASRLRKMDKSEIAKCREALYGPLHRKRGPTPDSVTKRIQEILFPYDVLILKREERLKEALNKIDKISRNEGLRMAAKDLHGLVKLKETESLLLNAEMTLKASLMRTESRTGHFREDFPKRDDANWLKWIVLKRGADGVMNLRTEPLPLDRYKYKPQPAAANPSS